MHIWNFSGAVRNHKNVTSFKKQDEGRFRALFVYPWRVRNATVFEVPLFVSVYQCSNYVVDWIGIFPELEARKR